MGKHVVITGVTRGLGRAMALEFARLGHDVCGCGRNLEQLQSLSREIGPRAHLTLVDVTDEQQVREWALEILKDRDAPDLLINNAAVINRNAKLWELSGAECEQVFAVNLGGVARVIRHFVPAMIARGRGVVVNFSSYWGRTTAPDVGPYCASKWGIEGITRSLAQELPAGLAAVAFNPGVIDTDMLRSCFGAAASQHASPEAWASAAVPFLLALGPKHNGKALTAPGQ
jgi:NAD(P)-dependent dehydrogenase (short-subunit alcohol dehydrogenase family)